MEIGVIDGKVKCDIAICRNRAKYSIDSKVSTRQNINLCEDCAKQLYLELGKIFTPKSPKNLISKADKEGKN